VVGKLSECSLSDPPRISESSLSHASDACVQRRIQPLANFTGNLAVYNANTARDRDKGGIACEKL
jgi:Excalibur calcium-binding domain